MDDKGSADIANRANGVSRAPSRLGFPSGGDIGCLIVFGVGGAVALPVEPISTTVDDAQIPTKRFATDVVVRKVTIDTEQVKSIETGSMNNVSSVEIWLER